ncbi:inc metabolism membrane protein [Rhodotorula sphaerocarpa]
MATTSANTSALKSREQTAAPRPRVRRSASSARWHSTGPAVLPPPSSPAGGRRRSHSLYDSSYSFAASRALQYGSHALQSLDLPASLVSLREYLVSKLEAAEHSLEALKATVEESETEDAGLSSANEDDDGEDADSDGMGSDAEETDSLLHDSLHDLRSSVTTAEEREEILEEISSLQAFIAGASSFLAAMREELPYLASAARADEDDISSRYLHFRLSPDAQATLDRILEEHPLPSLPNLDLRSRATSSAHAVVERALLELSGIRDALSQIASNTLPTNLLPSLPPMPSSRSISDLRAYFSEESARLSAAVSHFKDGTSESLSAGFHRMQDGAAELSTYVKDQGLAVMDEAMRMYHQALEIGRERLLRYEELPEEWRNNPHILHGYRYIPIEQYPALLKSMFEWHNETINIQSHFIGFLSLAGLLIYYLVFSPASPHPLVDPHPGDTAIAVLFVVSAMHCLLCSTAWHLFAGCATTGWFQSAACIDYVGISGLIAASVAGSTYYGFYDHPQLANAYMTFNFIVGGIGMLVPWQSWFNERKYKMWRIAFFVSLAASAVAPIAHRSFLIGLGDTLRFYSPAVPSVMAYLAGLLFYANQFPECCSPGSWHIGASHQLWHVAIVAAVWLHWKAMSDWSTTVALARVAGLHVEAALGGTVAAAAAGAASTVGPA